MVICNIGKLSDSLPDLLLLTISQPFNLNYIGGPALVLYRIISSVVCFDQFEKQAGAELGQAQYKLDLVEFLPNLHIISN